jgi:hypothetical protein
VLAIPEPTANAPQTPKLHIRLPKEDTEQSQNEELVFNPPSKREFSSNSAESNQSQHAAKKDEGIGLHPDLEKLLSENEVKQLKKAIPRQNVSKTQIIQSSFTQLTAA